MCELARELAKSELPLAVIADLLRARASVRFRNERGGSARRPERDEVLGAITAAGVRALGGEAIAQLVHAGAAAGASAAALTDLLDGASAIIDHGIQVAIRGGVTEADQHGG